MAIIVTADYTGRLADILAWDWGTVLDGDQLLNPTLAIPGQGGKIIAGISKLGQRFLLELLTEQGSMLYQPERGSGFMMDLRAGFLRNNEEVQQAFASALIDITRNLIQDQIESDPLDERFVTAQLTQVTIIDDKLSIQVVIVSEAGTQKAILVPLTTAVGV